jgi:hypothetical protein
MGKNRGSGRIKPIAGLIDLRQLTESELEAFIQKWKDHYPKLQEYKELLGKKGPEIVTTITTRAYVCEKCGMSGISEGALLKKNDQKFHIIHSGVSGGGSRICGPVKEEVKP